MVVVSKGSWMLTPNEFSASGALDAGFHDPGTGPVTTIHSNAAIAVVSSRVAVQRILGRCVPIRRSDLACGLVGREHVEGVAHFLQGRVGDLQYHRGRRRARQAQRPTR